MAKVKFAGRVFQLPQSRLLRLPLGAAFVMMGVFGFLPVLGFWMIPVGLAILSVDSPLARRLRRRGEVWLLRRYARWRNGRTGGDESNPPRS